MTSCVMTLKPKLLPPGFVTPAKRVDRRIKTFHAAQQSVATNVVCINHVHREYSNVCLDRTCSSAQTVFLGQPNNANKISCLTDRFRMILVSKIYEKTLKNL